MTDHANTPAGYLAAQADKMREEARHLSGEIWNTETCLESMKRNLAYLLARADDFQRAIDKL